MISRFWRIISGIMSGCICAGSFPAIQKLKGEKQMQPCLIVLQIGTGDFQNFFQLILKRCTLYIDFFDRLCNIHIIFQICPQSGSVTPALFQVIFEQPKKTVMAENRRVDILKTLFQHIRQCVVVNYPLSKANGLPASSTSYTHWALTYYLHRR